MQNDRLRKQETEIETANRQMGESVRHEVARSQATPEERLVGAITDRFLHQVNISLKKLRRKLA
jgi:hypothetical protein